jgi:hypothetical protein
MEEKKVSFDKDGKGGKYVEKEEEMEELESYWRTSYAREWRCYNKQLQRWKKDIKHFGHFTIGKRPTLPLTPEERKERYVRRKSGEKVEEEAEEDSNSELESENQYPSDYKSDEDPFSDGDAYKEEDDINLELKPRKKRWLGLRRQKRREDVIKQKTQSC